MKSAIVTIRGVSPYSQSKAHEEPKLPKELHDDYEKRTWRSRMHVTPSGYVLLPASALANAIKEAAKYLSIPVPGAGKATFTKHFDAGVMVLDGIVLAAKATEVPSDRLFVPSDGRPGGGKRVWKWFPRIDEWGGTFTALVVDDIIVQDVFKTVMTATGQIIGLGRFRPRNRGFYGRFEVESIVWRNEEETLAAFSERV
jgi:hypothetical protein